MNDAQRVFAYRGGFAIEWYLLDRHCDPAKNVQGK
jgi:hypothetical protein